MQTVYLLRDPITRESRYVGITVSLAKRLREHRNDKRENHRANWIQSIYRRGLIPLVEILDVVADKCRVDAECAWILGFRQNGADLINATDGGEGTRGLEFSSSHRRKLSEAKNRIAPERRREIASNAAKARMGYKHRLETIEKIRKSNLGKFQPCHTDQWKRDQSARSRNPENIKRLRHMAEMRKGKQRTQIERQHMSFGQFRRWARYRGEIE